MPLFFFYFHLSHSNPMWLSQSSVEKLDLWFSMPKIRFSSFGVNNFIFCLTLLSYNYRKLYTCFQPQQFSPNNSLSAILCICSLISTRCFQKCTFTQSVIKCKSFAFFQVGEKSSNHGCFGWSPQCFYNSVHPGRILED